ncbi:MAG: hypothetical protein ABIQ04_04465 [Candidatus Saccharimonadales bacterium]
MNKILGGAMRCGKTTLAKNICLETNLTRLSSDLIRKKIRSQLEKDSSHPLFAWSTIDSLRGSAWEKKHSENTDELVNLFINEATALQTFIKKEINDTKGDFLLEGSHILPRFALTVTDIAHITYVIDSSPDQFERVARAQKSPDKDFHYVQAWSYFNRAYGKYLQKQCKLYGIRCFDIADMGFEKTMATVAATLTTK